MSYYFVVTPVTFPEWQRALIAELRVGRLATVTPDGAPHVVPVCYAFVSGRFAIPIDEKPKRTTRLARLRNIDANPRASLLLDRYNDDWARLAWLRIDGVATTLTAGAEWPEALAALRERYPQYRAMALESRPVIAIEPQNTTAWRWSEAKFASPLHRDGDGTEG